MSKSGVAWFESNEASGNVLDSKGSFIGTPTNVIRVSDGQSGRALQFNGVDSYVQFNNKIIPVGRKSIYFRIKTNTIKTTTQTVLTTASLNQSGSYGLDFQISPIGQLSVAFREDTTPIFTSLTATLPIVDNQWHDVLFTWDGTTNTDAVALYIDDLQNPADTKTASKSETKQPSQNLVVGRGNNNFEDYRYFKGEIDNIQIYDDIIDTRARLSLIKSSNKIQVLTDGHWVDTGLTEPLTQQDFENFGIDDLSIVPHDKWIELDGEFEVITWTDNKEIAPVLLCLTTDPFSPMKKLNQEDNFEILTWTDAETNPKLELTIPQFRHIDKLNNEFKIITGRYKPI